MRWLAFGTYDAGRHPRVGVLIEGLRRHGDEVVEANVPIDLDTAGRIEIVRTPWRIPLVGLDLLRCWFGIARRSFGARPDVVLVGYFGLVDVFLARLLFPRTAIALDHMAPVGGIVLDRGLAAEGSRLYRFFALLDRWAAGVADVVMFDTAENAAEVDISGRHRTMVIPVGAETDWFRARPDLTGPPNDAGPLRVIFFGLFTALQGADVIGEALGMLADENRIRVTMVGQGQDLAACRAAAASNPNVSWVSWVDRDDLPQLVAAHDVCLGIFGKTRKTQRVVPTKLFQGAAAGCAIVTADTAPQRRAMKDAAEYVPAGNPRALADALRRLADDRQFLRVARLAASSMADSGFTPFDVVADLRLEGARHVGRQLRPGRGARKLTSDHAPHRTAPKGAALPAESVPLSPNATLRWEVVRPVVANLRPSSILEIGCGMGAMGARLVPMTDRYVAVEIDEQSCRTAKARIEPQGGRVHFGGQELLPDGEEFDLVCAFEVLEHIEDDDAHLRAWMRRVAPGGHLLLSVPADPERYGAADALVGHYRRYNPQMIEDLFDGLAVDGLRVFRYGWPFGYLLESGRNLSARKKKGAAGTGAQDMQQATHASGRYLQPRDRITGAAIRALVHPWARLQLRRPDRGTGLIVLASRPAVPEPAGDAA